MGKDLYNDRVEISVLALIEIKRAFRALIKDENSYIHKVFMDDYVHNALKELKKTYAEYFDEQVRKEYLIKKLKEMCKKDNKERQTEQLPQDAVMQSVLKASDLRIGNKLLFLGDVVTFKNITEFREDGIFWIKTFEPKIESKNFHFKPIPLTEEWLNKLGFFIVETNGTFEATLPNFRYSIQTAEDYDGFFFCDGETVLTNFNYLHELQNLVFVLGQRELTVA